MKRYDIYLDETKVKYLGTLPGTVSEQVRKSIDLLIETIENKKVGTSLSTQERGEH